MIEYNKFSVTELVALVRKDDRCALIEIFDRYHSYLYSFANERLNDSELAKEVVCDAFNEMGENRETADIRKAVTVFLLTLKGMENSYKFLCSERYQT